MTEFKRGEMVVSADWHLHPYKGESKDGGKDRLADGVRVLRQSLQLALSLKCPWVSLGDYKVPKWVWPQEALNAYIAAFEEFANVPKLLVAGNHDSVGEHGSGIYPFERYAEIVTEPFVYTSGVKAGGDSILGIPFSAWPHGSNMDDYPAFLKRSKEVGSQLLLSHMFLLGGLLGADEIRLPGEGTTLKTLGVGPTDVFRLALFGDIHKRQFWTWAQGGRSRWQTETPGRVDNWNGMALYPGDPYMQSWGEREDPVKGFLHIKLDEGVVKVYESKAPKFILLDPPPSKLDRTINEDFVRLRFPHGTSDAYVKTWVDKNVWNPRTLWVDIAPAPPEAQSRLKDVHAGKPIGDILRAYVEARPFPAEFKVTSDQVLGAGLKLTEDDA